MEIRRGAQFAIALLFCLSVLLAYSEKAEAGFSCTTWSFSGNGFRNGQPFMQYWSESHCDYTPEGITGGGGQNRSERRGGGGKPRPRPNNGSVSQPSQDATIKSGECEANPVIRSTGNKVEPEMDFAATGEMPLYLERTYNHYWHGIGIFGKHWLSNFDYSLVEAGSTLWVQYPDGRRVKFNYSAASGRYLEEKSQPIAWAVKNSDGTYTVHNESRGQERYRADGRVAELRNEQGITWVFSYNGTFLQRVTHASGRHLQFEWNGNEVSAVIDPAGNVYRYAYTPNVFGTGRGRLASSTTPGPGATTVAYHYEDARFAGGLTGKSFNGSRFSYFAYDSAGRAILSEHAGGADRYTFEYIVGAEQTHSAPPATPPPGGYLNEDERGWCEYRNGTKYCEVPTVIGGGETHSKLMATSVQTTSGTVTVPSQLTVVVTNPLGKKTRYLYLNGKLASVTGEASPNCAASGKSTSYDAAGYPDQILDFNGNITDLDHDAQGHLLRRTEAAGTPQQRVTEYVWDTATNRLLRERLVGVRELTYGYDASGRITVVVERNLSGFGIAGAERITQTAYTLHANGLVATITQDGPVPGSGDATVSHYNEFGDLVSVTNSLGHATAYANHNGLGMAGRVVGVNGAVVEYFYDGRGRVTTLRRWVAGTAHDTTYQYANELLAATTAPDGVQTRYVYDAARRLTKRYSREAAGTYAYQRTEYNAMSLPLSETLSRTAYPDDTRIIGNIDSIADTGGGGFVIRGWACSTGVDAPIAVHMYLGGAAGTGAHGFAYGTGVASEWQVASACGAHGTAYRFAIPVDTTMRQNYGGKTIWIHGISPAGRDNSLISSSGAFIIPRLPAAPLDDAQFVSQSVPSAMDENGSYAVSVTMRNVGNTTWSPSTGRYALGSQNPHDNTMWTGSNRVALPHAVAPGEAVTFSFWVAAGSAGTRNFQWRMVNDGVAWFGPQTPNVTVSIAAPWEPPPPPPCGPIVCEVPAVIGPSPTWGDRAMLLATRDNGAKPRTGRRLAVGATTSAASLSLSPGEVVSYSTFVDYDELGRMIGRRGNGGQNVRYAYDANSNLRSVTDAKGVTTLGYDALNRVLHQIAPGDLGTTRFEHNAADQVTKVTDPRGLATTYVYDGFGQLWAQNSPDTGTTSFQFNAVGQLAAMTRNDGSWLHYQYDGSGRVTYIGNNELRREYSYDWCQNGKGHLCGFETADTARVLTLTHYGYSVEGLTTIRRDLDYTIGSDDWTSYSYDGMGRLAGISYPSGVSVGYGYSHGELSLMQASFGGATHTVATGMQYLPFGALTRMTYGSGQIKERSYDLDGRMTVTHDHGMLGHTMTYNAADEITSIHNWSRPSDDESFSYDALSRLTNISSPQGDQAISYDANGNRTQHNWWVPQGGFTAYVPYWVDPASNRAHDQHIAVNYDARGNRSSQAVGGSNAVFAYDAFNRMRSVSRDAPVAYMSPGARYSQSYPAGTTVYTVNALDQRIAKSGPAGTTRFIYGGQTQLLAEGTTNVGWTSYLWLGSEAIGMVRHNQLYFFNNDHLGRPEIVANQVGNHVWHAANFAFDRYVTYDAIGGLNLGLPGQYFDAETGFWHNGFRDYDSRTGRYLQSDPIGLAGGINTYTYVEGNPVNLIDPLGLRGGAAARPPVRYPTQYYTYQNNAWQRGVMPPGPQPATRLYFSNYHQFTRPTLYAESMKRQVWSEANALSKLGEAFKQLFSSDEQEGQTCAVMVCGPWVNEANANSCPNPAAQPKAVMTGPEGSTGCMCLD